MSDVRPPPWAAPPGLGPVQPPPVPLPAPAPKAPGATLSLVLGLVSLLGLFVLVLPVFLAPLACYHAVAARRRIAREPGRWSGDGQAQAGLMTALVASVLMIVLLGLLGLAGLGTLITTMHDSGYGT